MRPNSIVVNAFPKTEQLKSHSHRHRVSAQVNIVNVLVKPTQNSTDTLSTFKNMYPLLFL